MNQKDIRIKKLWDRGVRSKGEIARKIGYGGAIEDGIRRMDEGLERLGIKETSRIRGKISDVRTFDEVLDASEIQKIYAEC